MDDVTLRTLREAVRLSQIEAAEKIYLATGGKVRKDRRAIIEAEKEGTDSLALLRGMALVYGSDFQVVMQANDRTRSSYSS